LNFNKTYYKSLRSTSRFTTSRTLISINSKTKASTVLEGYLYNEFGHFKLNNPLQLPHLTFCQKIKNKIIVEAIKCDDIQKGNIS